VQPVAKAMSDHGVRARSEVIAFLIMACALIVAPMFAYPCMSSEHFGQLAWQFKRVSGSSGLKVQAAIAC
jgi:nitrate reductase NapE component